MSQSRLKVKQNGILDDGFDAFMAETNSEDESTIDTARIDRFLNSPKPGRKANLMDISSEDDNSDGGLMGTGQMFLKKKESKLTEKRNKTPEPQRRLFASKCVADLQDIGTNRDSLEDESLSSYRQNKGKADLNTNHLIPELNLGASSASYTDTATGQFAVPTAGHLAAPTTATANEPSLKVGAETLDEMAERERFFKELEQNEGKGIDYRQKLAELAEDETLAPGAATLNTMNYDLPQDKPGHLRPTSDLDSTDEYQHERPVAKKRSSQSNLFDKQNGEQPMLSRVALVDSMGSSLDSKPRASRDPDAAARDMNTIDESRDHSDDDVDDSHVAEVDVDDCNSANDDGGVDEVDAQPAVIVFTPGADPRHATDDVTELTDTHGVKTQTGYGDTSREMQRQYQDAL